MKKNWLKAIIGCVLSLTMAFSLGGCFGKIKDFFPRPNTSETSSAPNTSVSVGGTSTTSPDDTGIETDDGNPLCEEYGHLYGWGVLVGDCDYAYEQKYCTRPNCNACIVGGEFTDEHDRNEYGVCVACGDGAGTCDGNHLFNLSYGIKVLETPTCTNVGLFLTECLNADCSTMKQVEVRARGHDYKNGICNRCGLSDGTVKPEDDEVISPPTVISPCGDNHNLDYGIIVGVGTCEEGKKYITYCKNKGCEVFTEQFSANTYSCTYENGVCTKCGNGLKYCDGNHKFGSLYMVNIELPTCTEVGLIYYQCTNKGCTMQKQEELLAFGHSYENGKCTYCGQNE